MQSSNLDEKKIVIDSHKSKSREPGNTFLHEIVQNSSSFEEFSLLLKNIPKIELPKMAITVNNDGKIPIEILLEKLLLSEEKEKIFNFLLPITLEPTLPRLSLETPINFDDMIKKYNPKPGSALEKNLKAAWCAATIAKIYITDSSTHPQINDKDCKTILNLNNKIHSITGNAMSKIGTSIVRSVLGVESSPEMKLTYLSDKRFKMTSVCHLEPETVNSKPIDAEIEFSTTTTQQIYSSIADELKRKPIGDCISLAVIALAAGNNSHRKELFSMGGHTFVVFDREVESKVDDYKTWGDSAVICDPWRGVVSPTIFGEFAAFKSFAYNFSSTPQLYNCITFYNPNFHTFNLSINYYIINNINFKLTLHSEIDSAIKKNSIIIKKIKKQIIEIGNELKSGNVSSDVLNRIKITKLNNLWSHIVTLVKSKIHFGKEDFANLIDILVETSCQAIDNRYLFFFIEDWYHQFEDIIYGISAKLLANIIETLQLPRNIGLVLFEYLKSEFSLSVGLDIFIDRAVKINYSRKLETKQSDIHTYHFNILRNLFNKEIDSYYFKTLKDSKRTSHDIFSKDKIVIKIRDQFNELEKSDHPDRVLIMLGFLLNESERFSTNAPGFFLEATKMGSLLNKITKIFIQDNLVFVTGKSKENLIKACAEIYANFIKLEGKVKSTKYYVVR